MPFLMAINEESNKKALANININSCKVRECNGAVYDTKAITLLITASNTSRHNTLCLIQALYLFIYKGPVTDSKWKQVAEV